MTVLLIAITLFCLLLPIYVYFGYPVILWLLTRNKGSISHFQNDIEPTVTLIISCYNETDVIEKKLENALALNYPKGRLSIVVVSDGSDDGTDEIVRSFEKHGVRLMRQEGRLGKTQGLNMAMESVRSDCVVFSDANAMYHIDAIKKLVRNFADERVGYVVGAALYTDEEAGASAGSENLYWRYELAIKTMESQLHSVVGGDGAIYAIRTALWEPLQQRDINDFVNPLQIVGRGFRGVFDGEARCYEETAGSFDKEVARKERIVNRSIRGLMRVKGVMNPLRTGFFSFEVISHKLLRWMIPLFLGVGVIGSTLLVILGYAIFQPVVIGAFVLTALAGLAHFSKNKNELPVFMATPYYFIMVNAYAVKGVLKALQGQTQVTWTSARLPGGPTNTSCTSCTASLIFLSALVGMAYALITGLLN